MRTGIVSVTTILWCVILDSSVAHLGMADNPHPLHRRTSRTLQRRDFISIVHVNTYNAANIQILQIHKFRLAYFEFPGKGKE
jgi:hypothetical protein